MISIYNLAKLSPTMTKFASLLGDANGSLTIGELAELMDWTKKSASHRLCHLRAAGFECVVKRAKPAKKTERKTLTTEQKLKRAKKLVKCLAKQLASEQRLAETLIENVKAEAEVIDEVLESTAETVAA